MFATLSRRLVARALATAAAAALATLLTACGGQDQGPSTAQNPVVAADVSMAMPTSQMESTVVTMHGGGASVISTEGDNPALATEEERQQMALSMVEYEKSYSIEMNRQHDEWVARQKAAEEAIRNGSTEGCLDPSGYDCPVEGKE
ncbi:MAG: hypothetical protein ACLGI6_14065 [Gammaproteobacteria bacterium]